MEKVWHYAYKLSTYCSDEDLWKAHFVVLKNREEKVIPAGTRLLQFEVVPSQKSFFLAEIKMALFFNTQVCVCFQT